MPLARAPKGFCPKDTQKHRKTGTIPDHVIAVMHEAALFSSPGATTEVPRGCSDQVVNGRAITRKVVGAVKRLGIWRDIRTTKEMLGRRKVLGEMISKMAVESVELKLKGGPGQ